MKWPKLSLFIIWQIGLQTALAQPVITNISPASGAVIKSGTTITFSATVTSAHPGLHVTFVIPYMYDYGNANSLTLWVGEATQSGNIWSVTWPNANIPPVDFICSVGAYDTTRASTSVNIVIHVITNQWNINLATNTTYDTIGNIGIGTSNTQTYQLAVNGPAIFTKMTVKPYASWPDYVFRQDYELPSLESIDNYIKAHGRLPEMPAADSVQRNGIDVGEDQVLLLKKIEELTLYFIGQKQKLESLGEQRKRIDAQQARIERLERMIEQPER